MQILIIVLRLIHILSGVFWAGSAFFLVSYLIPAVKASGPEGGKVMQRLTQSTFSSALAAAGGLSVLSGFTMYWLDSGGLQIIWIMTRAGLAFSFGAIAGVIALGIGLFVSKPATDRLAALGKTIQSSGKPPTPDQLAVIQKLQETLIKGAIWVSISLALAVAAMAIARYL